MRETHGEDAGSGEDLQPVQTAVLRIPVAPNEHETRHEGDTAREQSAHSHDAHRPVGDRQVAQRRDRERPEQHRGEQDLALRLAEVATQEGDDADKGGTGERDDDAVNGPLAGTAHERVTGVLGGLGRHGGSFVQVADARLAGDPDPTPAAQRRARCRRAGSRRAPVAAASRSARPRRRRAPRTRCRCRARRRPTRRR